MFCDFKADSKVPKAMAPEHINDQKAIAAWSSCVSMDTSLTPIIPSTACSASSPDKNTGMAITDTTTNVQRPVLERTSFRLK